MKTAAHAPALDGLPAILLRNCCDRAECRDAGSGQLGSVTDLPPDASVAGTAVAGSNVEVVSGPDGHRAVFSREWLAEQRRPPDDDRTEDAKRLWAAADAGAVAGLRRQDWPRSLDDPAATGQRHLQGCYTDLDGVAPALAVLRRAREATLPGARG